MNINELITANKTDAEILAIGNTPRPHDIDLAALRVLSLDLPGLSLLDRVRAAMASPTTTTEQRSDLSRALDLFTAPGVVTLAVGSPQWTRAVASLTSMRDSGLISVEEWPAFADAAYDLAPLYTQADIDRARREKAVEAIRSEIASIYNNAVVEISAYCDNGGTAPTLDDLLAWRPQD